MSRNVEDVRSQFLTAESSHTNSESDANHFGSQKWLRLTLFAI